MINISGNQKDTEFIEKATFLICYLLKNLYEYDNVKVYLNTFFTRNKEGKKFLIKKIYLK